MSPLPGPPNLRPPLTATLGLAPAPCARAGQCLRSHPPSTHPSAAWSWGGTITPVQCPGGEGHMAWPVEHRGSLGSSTPCCATALEEMESCPSIQGACLSWQEGTSPMGDLRPSLGPSPPCCCLGSI